MALLLVPFNLKPQSGEFGLKKDTLDGTDSSLLECVGTARTSYDIRRFWSENGILQLGKRTDEGECLHLFTSV